MACCTRLWRARGGGPGASSICLRILGSYFTQGVCLYPFLLYLLNKQKKYSGPELTRTKPRGLEWRAAVRGMRATGRGRALDFHRVRPRRVCTIAQSAGGESPVLSSPFSFYVVVFPGLVEVPGVSWNFRGCFGAGRGCRQCHHMSAGLRLSERWFAAADSVLSTRPRTVASFVLALPTLVLCGMKIRRLYLARQLEPMFFIVGTSSLFFLIGSVPGIRVPPW